MTSDAVNPHQSDKRDELAGRQLSPEQAAAAAMVAEARARGLHILGEELQQPVRAGLVSQNGLKRREREITEHLGYEKNRAEPGRPSANVRNGTRPKTVISDAAGEIRIDVPRDRDGTFEPQIVKKRQRRIGDVDESVLSLYAKGLTTGEISAHFAEIDGASVSKETVSQITKKVVAEMQEWATRPLDTVYVGLYRRHRGQGPGRPDVTARLRGHRRHRRGLQGRAGPWSGTGGEGARFWLRCSPT